MMHGREKSDSAIVAMKPANKAGQPAAERVERRAEAEGNMVAPRMRRTPSRESMNKGSTVYGSAANACIAVITQGGSPVRELRTPGSVRGVRSNAHPYRDVRRENGEE